MRHRSLIGADLRGTPAELQSFVCDDDQPRRLRLRKDEWIGVVGAGAIEPVRRMSLDLGEVLNPTLLGSYERGRAIVVDRV